MVRKNKRGWLRIFEATIAIMIVAGVLMVMYSRGVEKADVEEYMYNLQKEVLMELGTNPDLRISVVRSNSEAIRSFAETKIPAAFEFEIKICNLTDEAGNILPCKMTEYVEKDIYSDEVIISSDLDAYSPKKVALFIWDK